VRARKVADSLEPSGHRIAIVDCLLLCSADPRDVDYAGLLLAGAHKVVLSNPNAVGCQLFVECLPERV
jgi:hypothetical protein